jgi:hypothetical protein
MASDSTVVSLRFMISRYGSMKQMETRPTTEKRNCILLYCICLFIYDLFNDIIGRSDCLIINDY